jgi:hypothetical protein
MYRSFLFLLLIATLSCRKDAKGLKSTKKTDVSFTETATSENSKPTYIPTNSGDKPIREPKSLSEELAPPTMQELRAQGESIYKKRMSEKAQPMTALDVSRWGYDGEFVDGKFKPIEEIGGRWIDFSEKWTYTYGKNSNKIGGGKYHYNSDTQLLLLLDNNKEAKPVEYKVKIVNDALVLMGQATYGDGGYQAKFTREKVK